MGDKKEFYDLSEFSFVEKVESEYPQIRQEAMNLYPDQRLSWPVWDTPEADKGTWSISPLVIGFSKITHVLDQCPAIAETLNYLPPVSVAAISYFQPGANLKPHEGPDPSALIYHLALKIPGDCGIQVNGVHRTWQEGKSLIFDDTHTHHAWNASSELRVILFAAFLKPEYRGIVPKQASDNWDIIRKRTILAAFSYCRTHAPDSLQFAADCFKKLIS